MTSTSIDSFLLIKRWHNDNKVAAHQPMHNCQSVTAL